MKIEAIENSDVIKSYFYKEKGIVVLISIFGILYNIGMIYGPIYQGKMIDSLNNNAKLEDTLRLVGLFFGFITITQIFRYFKRLYVRKFANNTGATMRLMVYNNIINLSLEDLESENTGNLMTRVISDVDLCVEGMRKFTTEVFDTGVLMIAYIVTLLYYDVQITLLAIIFVPLAMIIAEKLKNRVYTFNKAFRSQSAVVTDLTYRNVENAVLYRISGMESYNKDFYDAALSDLEEKSVKATILETSMQPIYNVVAMFGIMIIIVLGGKNVSNGIWTIGYFSTYITLFTAMAFKASKASKLFNSVQKSQVSWQRIKPYLGNYTSDENEIIVEKATIEEIVVKDLKFRYREELPNVIEQLGFVAKKGEVIGITGSVASGKSAVGYAMTGYYPYFGHIIIDGKEWDTFSKSEKSSHMSYLAHDHQLLSDTVEMNVKLGQSGDIKGILSGLGLDVDLSTMKEGEKTIVGNSGGRLSGGQGARVALARTLYDHKPLIILDDPFASIDLKTEEKIMNYIKSNFQDSIVLLISHRITAFSKLDQVIYLEQGVGIVSNHASLMRDSKEYAEIFELQKHQIGGKYDQ